MKKTKTILSVLLTAVMLLTMFTAVPFSAGAAGNRYDVSTAQDLKNAAEQIENAGSGTFDIYITDNFSVAGGVSFNNPDAVVNIFGEDHIINFSGTSQGFNVMNGTTLNLGALDYDKSLTLSGDGIAEVDGGLIYINNVTGPDSPNTYNTEKQSVCNMYDGVTVKNHKADSNYGGGVAVEGTIFNMYGGTIENCGIDRGSVCYGGGVAVINGGVFNMNDGTIKNCYAKSDYIDDTDPNRCFTAMGGGVFVTSGSTFTMNGGTISGNEATNFGGGIALDISYQEMVDNGMGNIQSKVNINGGTIKDNKADCGAGVFVSGYFYCYAGVFKGHGYGGVGSPSDPGLSINGGEISGNVADDMGGGVLMAMTRPNKAKISNASIKNNKAREGAGIENFGYWTNLDINGCAITGNTATDNGGGVMASTNSSGGCTLIKNTTITGNTSGDRGAGVYYDGASILNISGANTIQNNYYGSSLNNLNVYSVDNPVNVVGDLTGSQVGLSDPRLWDDNLTDAAAPDDGSAELLTNGYKTNNPDVHPSEYFTSDHETWFVDRTKKTITKIDDPNSKSYREYTVKRYEYIPASDPKMNPLYGQPDEYVVSDIKNPDIQNITSFADLYNEIKYKYSDTSKYTKGTDVNSNGNIYLQYKILDNTYPTSVTLRKQSSKSYATIDFAQDPTIGKGGTITYRVYLSDQTSYANSKEIVYRLDCATSLTQYYVFSDTCTTETVKYVNATPPSDTLYEYDDYGNLIAKLEIEGGKDNYTIQKTQIETVTGNDNEVRLVRKTTPVKFHDNKDKVGKGDDKLFRVYNAEKPADFANITEDGADHSFNNKGGVDEFYSIPKFAEDDYVFAGWYTVADNDDNSESKAFEFGSSVSPEVEDVYAHWIPVGTVDKDGNDDKELLSGKDYTYSGFGLFGVQIRKPYNFDANYGDVTPGGLRFVTSIKNSLLEDIDNLSEKTVGDNQNKVEYGYVTAGEKTVEKFLEKTSQSGNGYKIQYNDKNVNGVDTTQKQPYADNYRYVKNVDCTAKDYSGKSNIVDHRKFSDYRLATMVITYDDKEHPAANAEDMEARIVARAYIRYYDANGLLRTFYNDYGDYGGTNVYGGCCTSFEAASGAYADNEHTMR